MTAAWRQVQRIWQPDERTIRMRWKLHGVPRIPWEVEGIFEGISNFKLDKCAAASVS